MIPYETFGNVNGPLIVFLHGGGVSGWMWNKQIESFKNYHCLLPTLQGHSTRSHGESFSIQESALEMIDLIHKLKNDRDVHLVGFSLGGQIAIEILSLEPNLIRTAMINSAVVKPNKFLKKIIPALIKLTFPLVKNKKFAKLQAKQLYIDDELFDQYYKDSLTMKRDILIQVLQENATYSLPNAFSESTATIVVTVGEKEKRAVKKSAFLIADKKTNSKTLLISAIGHGFPLAKPDFFNKVLKDLITSTQ